MSDSFGRISSPPPTSNVGGGRGQTVQILNLPTSVANSAKALRIEGQITQITNEGNARITTAEGDIEVRVRGNKQPQLGQKVELDVPAGKQQRHAIIREAPQQSAPSNERNSNTAKSSNPIPTQTVITNPRITSPVQQNAPQASTNNTAASSTNQTTIKQPPVPATLQEAASSQPTQQGRTLPTDAIVRLLSAPPAQAQKIAAEFVQTLPQPQQTAITRVAFSANLIAQNAQNALQTPLLQVAQSSLPQPSINAQAQPQSILQNLTQPLTNNNIFTPITTPQQTGLQQPQITFTPSTNTQTTNIIPSTIQPIGNSNNIVIPTGQTLPITSANTILNNPTANIAPTNTNNTPTPQSATLQPLPVGFDPSNPNSLVTSRTNKIDIQVIKITPPVTTITPANTTPQNSIVPAKTQFTPPIISGNTATTITAQVTGFTQAGLPLVTAQLPGTTVPQSFILQFKSNNLQLGSQLQITPKAAQTPLPSLVNSARQFNFNNLMQGFQWPAIDALYNSLNQLSPQAAASLTRSLPNAGNPSQMGAAAMMFIAAVKSGDLSSFLGSNKMDALEKAGKSDILSKLTQRPSGSGQAAAVEPAASNDWKAVPLPMFWEGEIHKITLFTRQENQNQQQDNEGNSQTRFVFDLSLSRMGDVQLDGLLRDNRLDLMVRTQNAFSAPMQQVMRQAYSGALNQTELSGELNFQGSTKNWVHVLEQKEQLGVDV